MEYIMPRPLRIFTFNKRPQAVILPKMFLFFLVTLLVARVIALPPRLDDIVISPLERDGDIAFFNGSNPSTPPTCYEKRDPVFFSLMSSSFYNFEKCKTELSTFSRSLNRFGRDKITFWYTTNHFPPHGLSQPALQLPVFHNTPDCSFAVTSPKLLNEFATEKNIPWRHEWGPRTAPLVYDEVEMETVKNVLSDGGFISALSCVHQGGKAGFQPLGE